MRSRIVLAAVCAIAFAGPVGANFVTEPSFEQVMERSDVVVIGTVTATDRGGRGGFGSTATLSVLRTMKGYASDTITVSTYSRINEMNPRCCDVGATYMMFLVRSPDGQLASVWGAYGMRRVAGPLTRAEVVTSPER